MNLIKALLSHQYDAIKQEASFDLVVLEHQELKFQAINTLLQMDKLKLIICDDNDVTCNVSIDESVLRSLFIIDPIVKDFIPFSAAIADEVYTYMYYNNLNDVMVKLKSGDTITCDLKWEQGHGNNYYFINEYLGVRISIDDVVGYKFI